MMLRGLIWSAVISAALLAPAAASACPLCKEAISTADPTTQEVNNLPAAYNNSIMLMIGVPYLCLGTVGFLVYRGLKKNAAYLEARQLASRAPSPAG